ncbi:hypothetical protein IJ541_05430 [bacterium]|nr:hypothetical protein [bacterium]
MKKFFAFTLAEVLITLGIIGVVSALTLPNFLHNYYEKQTVAKLKSTYSILSRAIKLSSEDNGLPEEWNMTGRNKASSEIAARKLLPYLKAALDCGTDDIDNKCVSKNRSLLNGTVIEWGTNSYKILLLNGASLIIAGGEQSNGIYLYFQVDINGIAKPNVWGRDIFEFSYRENLGLLPSGNPQNASNTYKTFCKDTNSTGYGCAYYVLQFGNMNYLRKK